MNFIDFEAVVKVCIAVIFLTAAVGVIVTWAFSADAPAPAAEHDSLAVTWFPIVSALYPEPLTHTEAGFEVFNAAGRVTACYEEKAVFTFSETEGKVFDVPLANVFAEFCSNGHLPLIEAGD